MIEAFLQDLELLEHLESFQSNGIDETILLSLNDNDLRDLGVSQLGHRKKILAAIEAHNEVNKKSKTDKVVDESHATLKRDSLRWMVLYFVLIGLSPVLFASLGSLMDTWLTGEGQGHCLFTCIQFLLLGFGVFISPVIFFVLFVVEVRRYTSLKR